MGAYLYIALPKLPSTETEHVLVATFLRSILYQEPTVTCSAARTKSPGCTKPSSVLIRARKVQQYPTPHPSTVPSLM
jgi:hypothetical protein